MTEMFGEAWSPMSVPDLAPDDDDDAFTFRTVQIRVDLQVIEHYESMQNAFLCKLVQKCAMISALPLLMYFGLHQRQVDKREKRKRKRNFRLPFFHLLFCLTTV